MTTFRKRIAERVKNTDSVLCIGLDSDIERLPHGFLGPGDPQVAFNRAIIDATQDLAVCYKPNAAFYEARGAEGWTALAETARYLRSLDIPSIADAKRGDIGNTAYRYAKAFFECMDFDAITVNPYMGEDAISPFREYPEAGVFILCYTSNKSRQDFQTQLVDNEGTSSVELYKLVAQKIRQWDSLNNLGAVVGATAPEELGEIRTILGPQVPILCPGIGAQGGDLEETLRHGQADRNGNVLINVSRSVLFASSGKDFAKAAREEAEKLVERMRAYFK
ncbi:MAG: orotidine-5'-phosphate decarboxylase [bacterium]